MDTDRAESSSPKEACNGKEAKPRDGNKANAHGPGSSRTREAALIRDLEALI